MDLYRRLLKLHFTFEESNELIRKRLAKRQKFSVHTAFSMLDYDSNGYIVADNIRRFLGESQIFVSDNELRSLMKRYDTNGDGRISYSEFV